MSFDNSCFETVAILGHICCSFVDYGPQVGRWKGSGTRRGWLITTRVVGIVRVVVSVCGHSVQRGRVVCLLWRGWVVCLVWRGRRVATTCKGNT